MGTLKDIFGICPVCGSDGGDKADASGADAPATDTTGSGVPLKYYKNALMCDICVKRLQADEESNESAKRHVQEEAFRARVGFVNTVE